MRWRTSEECSHTNAEACPTCDFDRHYSKSYPDCPWGSCAICGEAIESRGGGPWRASVAYPDYSAWCYGKAGGTLHEKDGAA